MKMAAMMVSQWLVSKELAGSPKIIQLLLVLSLVVFSRLERIKLSKQKVQARVAALAIRPKEEIPPGLY